MIIGPTSGIRLHNILVKSAFAAPMSFFESTDSSILLNRFSQDMSLIDMQLPLSAFGATISMKISAIAAEANIPQRFSCV
jgi:ATP-binding cassette subfamily C (CFTR/MRP) protein 1